MKQGTSFSTHAYYLPAIAGRPAAIGMECRCFYVKSSTGIITVETSGNSSFEIDGDSVYQFDVPTMIISIRSSVASDIVTMSFGYGIIFKTPNLTAVIPNPLPVTDAPVNLNLDFLTKGYQSGAINFTSGTVIGTAVASTFGGFLAKYYSLSIGSILITDPISDWLVSLYVAQNNFDTLGNYYWTKIGQHSRGVDGDGTTKFFSVPALATRFKLVLDSYTLGASANDSINIKLYASQ